MVVRLAGMANERERERERVVNEPELACGFQIRLASLLPTPRDSGRWLPRLSRTPCGWTTELSTFAERSRVAHYAR